jgi:hypothetical protein
MAHLIETAERNEAPNGGRAEALGLTAIARCDETTQGGGTVLSRSGTHGRGGPREARCLSTGSRMSETIWGAERISTCLG